MPPKLCERGGGRREGHLELEGHGQGGERVLHVVPARQGQLHRCRARRRDGAPRSACRRARPRTARRAQIGLRREAVGGDPAGHARQDRLHARVVEAEHREAPERDAVGEGGEGVLERREAAVVVEVLRVDVGHDGDHRREAQEAIRRSRPPRRRAGRRAEARPGVRARRIRGRARRSPRSGRGPRAGARGRSARWWWSCRGCRRRRCPPSGASPRRASRRAGSRGSCGARPRAAPGCSRAPRTSRRRRRPRRRARARGRSRPGSRASAGARRSAPSRRSEPVTR